MGNSLNKIYGKRKSANEDQNNTTQTVVPNTPVVQDQQRPMEGQRSDIQSVSKVEESTPGSGHATDNTDFKQNQTSGGLLYESVSNNLSLLDGLASCLDKEHPYGTMKCWKHLAEYFGVEESIYKAFTCCPQNSPTENLFYFLKTRQPTEFTIEKLKEGLNSTDRKDVIQDVLKKHQDLDSTLTDETTVGSLFDSHPLIIGKIAVLLDVNEPGKKNWRQLADWFLVPKSNSQNFGESIPDNPTEKLLEYILACLNPEMTVGYLQNILKDLEMQEASEVLTNNKKVTKNTLLKDLWDLDYDTADKLCNLLNQMYNSRIRSWRRLGHELNIQKDVLKRLSPNEDEVISPTEALLNHLGVSRVSLTMVDLILALDSIDRKDALLVIKDFIPDLGELVDKLLERKRSLTANVLSQDTE